MPGYESSVSKLLSGGHQAGGGVEVAGDGPVPPGLRYPHFVDTARGKQRFIHGRRPLGAGC